MKLSIRTRLAFSFSLIFIVLLAMFSSFIYYLMATDLDRELKKDSAHDAGQVMLEFSIGSWERQLAEMPEESAEFKLSIQIFDDQGRTVFLTKGIKPTDWPEDKVLLQRSLTSPVWSDVNIAGMSHLVLTQSFFPQGKPVHFIQIANSRADINHIKNQLIFWINIGTPLILIIAVIAGRFFARFALAPVEKIRARAQHIKSDNLSERLVYDGPRDELFSLTETLNDLLSRLEHSLNQIKRFIADASHELRIPLTGLRGTVEVALRQDRTKEEYKKTLEAVHSESERLSELVWDLLSLARADAGELKIEKQVVATDVFLNNVFEEAKILNADNKVTLSMGKIVADEIEIDEAKIHQLLINVFENAIRYNKPGGTVMLSAARIDDQLVISVEDSGMGIAPEDQKKIFERFYRVDKARAREAGGTGLGLSIAQSIAVAHNGTLTVESVLGEGSTFKLSLPFNS